MISSITQSNSSLISTGTTSWKNHRDEMFAKMDTNGDGKIDKAEFAAFAPKQPADASGSKPTSDEMFAKMDTNGDGSITKDEMEAFHKNHPHPMKAQNSSDLFAKMDSNGDGSISKAEFEAFLERMEQDQESSSASTTYTQTGSTIPAGSDSSLNIVG